MDDNKYKDDSTAVEDTVAVPTNSNLDQDQTGDFGHIQKDYINNHLGWKDLTVHIQPIQNN